jgi:DNA damage-binding protein 1
LLSTVQESHLFRFEGSNRLKHISSSSTGLITTEPTLALGNIPKRLQKKVAPGHNATSVYIDSSLVVQVTKQGIRLVEYDMALGEYTKVGDGWTPGMVQGGYGWDGREVVAAGVNASQFVLALNGARLVLLNLNEKNGFTRVA